MAMNADEGSGNSTLDVAYGDTVLDFEGAMQRLGGDMELFRDFIQVLDEDGPALIESLRSSAHAGDAARVERAAHSLRGLLSNLGAEQAVEVARALEHVGSSKQLSDAAGLLNDLDECLGRLRAALDNYRG
jgi:HPt (histidine-containing phosphotransfer) domain-containing protein